MNKQKTNNIPSIWKMIKLSMISIGVVVLIGVITIYILSLNLASIKDLENVDPAVASQIYSADGVKISELYTFNRLYVPYSKIPDHVIQALLSTEDREFMNHWGINLKRFPKALYVDIKTMSFSQGFSTITMQLARNLYDKKIGFKKNIWRKIKEILTAIEIERHYSKEEILEMYLNVIYFGRGAYGIEAAAQTYFSKSAEDLTLDEGAMLIGMLPAPEYYNPFKRPEAAIRRRNLVLHNMTIWSNLDPVTYDSIKSDSLTLHSNRDSVRIAPYFTEYVRIRLNRLQDSLGVNVYEDGLRIYTTLDTRLQAVMDSSVRKWYPVLQEQIRKDSKKEEWHTEIGDSLFNEKTVLQLGFVAIEPHTGHILALVGGPDFDRYKFNNVFQPIRQPGSAFKPILYTAAIDNGYLPTDTYLNQPIVVENPDGTRWTPENYDHSVGGPTPLREGLRRSLNLISIHLINDITPRVVVDYARRMGITTDLSPYAPLALGASGVRPIEIINAYSVFVNQGILVKPFAITRIEDRYGNIIYEQYARRKEVLSPVTSFIMTKLLENVINHGTGGSARWRYHFYKTAAGKTGTTNDYSDAWFIGFTPHLVTGIWTGLSDFRIKLGPGQTGAHTALPFWATFMKMAYDTLKYEDKDFPMPPGVVTRNICKKSFKLATDACPETYEEYFSAKNVPTATCDIHGNGHKRQKILF